MVRMTYACRGGCKELIVASAYLPYDSDEPLPTNEPWDITDYCHIMKEQHIIGCDASTHHILCGSSDTSYRGASFTEYLVSSNLNILIKVLSLPLWFAIG
jgi:hypothetical protein